MKKLLVSSCLVGKECAYDGRARSSERVMALCRRAGHVDACPEMDGGLGCPRVRHEITGGSGEDVAGGSARVVAAAGGDATGCFMAGAGRALEKAVRNGVSVAVLKEGSPSCGPGRIHSGNFDGTTRDGQGVTAALLRANGIKVFSEEEVEEAEKELDRLS